MKLNDIPCPIKTCIYNSPIVKDHCQRGIAATGVGCETTKASRRREEAIKFLSSIFLTCPETQKEMTIKSTSGAESGFDYTEIIAATDETEWKFKIYIEEK